MLLRSKAENGAVGSCAEGCCTNRIIIRRLQLSCCSRHALLRPLNHRSLRCFVQQKKAQHHRPPVYISLFIFTNKRARDWLKKPGELRAAQKNLCCVQFAILSNIKINSCVILECIKRVTQFISSKTQHNKVM